MTRRSTAAEWIVVLTLFFRPSFWREAKRLNEVRELELDARRRPSEPLIDVSGIREDPSMDFCPDPSSHDYCGLGVCSLNGGHHGKCRA